MMTALLSLLTELQQSKISFMKPSAEHLPITSCECALHSCGLDGAQRLMQPSVFRPNWIYETTSHLNLVRHVVAFI